MSIGLTVDFALWEKQLLKSIEKTHLAVGNTVIKAANELYKKIIDYTPVGNPELWHPPYWPPGYIPGTLKASWIIDVTKGGVDTEIRISNKQPYAYRVEYGWSTQAPVGMMRRANLEYPILIGRTAQEFKI